jgi:hypothetical protein
MMWYPLYCVRIVLDSLRQKLTESCGRILGTNSTHRNKKKKSLYHDVSGNIEFVSYRRRNIVVTNSVFLFNLAILCEMFLITLIVTDGLHCD